MPTLGEGKFGKDSRSKKTVKNQHSGWADSIQGAVFGGNHCRLARVVVITSHAAVCGDLAFLPPSSTPSENVRGSRTGRNPMEDAPLRGDLVVQHSS